MLYNVVVFGLRWTINTAGRSLVPYKLKANDDQSEHRGIHTKYILMLKKYVVTSSLGIIDFEGIEGIVSERHRCIHAIVAITHPPLLDSNPCD